MSTELFPVLAWTLSRLRTVTDNVKERPAPEGTKTPFVSYSLDADPHASYVDGRVAMARFELLVSVVGTGSPGTIKTLVEGVRGALHRQEGIRDNYHVSAREIAPFKLPVYRLNGVPFYEVGARFRILASRVPEVASVSP